MRNILYKKNNADKKYYIYRGDWIRTSDLLHPMQMRYQAALRPVIVILKKVSQ